MGMAGVIFALHLALCNALFFQPAVSHFTSLAHQLTLLGSNLPFNHYSHHGTSVHIWLFHGLLVTFLCFPLRHFLTQHGYLEGVFCKYPQLLYCFLNDPFKTCFWDAWRKMVLVRYVSHKTNSSWLWNRYPPPSNLIQELHILNKSRVRVSNCFKGGRICGQNKSATKNILGTAPCIFLWRKCVFYLLSMWEVMVDHLSGVLEVWCVLQC